MISIDFIKLHRIRCIPFLPLISLRHLITLHPSMLLQRCDTVIMRNQTHNLDHCRDWIVSRYKKGVSLECILDELQQKYNLEPSRRTLNRRLREWNIEPNQVRSDLTKECRNRCRYLFFEHGLSDKQLVRHLRLDGFKISLNGVVRIRSEFGLSRRWDPDALEKKLDEVRQFFEHEQITENVVARMGYRMLYVHLRQRQYNLPRDALFKIYAEEFHGDKVEERKAKVHRKRGGWTTPGPNYIHSIDAYCKLQPYGFEIYAGIDAYSRFITWFYTGISALTARSILHQYLYIVDQTGFLPLVIRSDRGNETHHVATAHHILSNASEGDRHPRINRESNYNQTRSDQFADRFENTFIGNIPAGPDEEEATDSSSETGDQARSSRDRVPFGDCWSYGKSTKNQRIEGWWGQLCQGRSIFWRVGTHQNTLDQA